MADRIRGQESTLQVTIDGVLQQGSFAKVENWKWSPISEIVASDFIGESESDFDPIHHGFEFSFSIHEKENSAVEQFLLGLVDQLASGATLSTVNIVIIKKYR